MTIVCDLQPFRLETAARLGADYTLRADQELVTQRVMEITRGQGVDCVIEAVGHYHLGADGEAPLAQAVKMIRNGGRIVTTGLGEQLTAIHFKTLVLKEAAMIASRVTRGEFPRAIRLLSKGLLHPQLLVTEKAPLRHITSAFKKVDQEDPQTIKIVLELQES
jgi:threonine dehydrogenase-like Zn-dependent dehydrogenase